MMAVFSPPPFYDKEEHQGDIWGGGLFIHFHHNSSKLLIRSRHGLPIRIATGWQGAGLSECHP